MAHEEVTSREYARPAPGGPWFVHALPVIVMMLCVLPMALQIARPGDAAESAKSEGRALSPWPGLPRTWQDWLDFPKKAERYASDTMGLRATLLDLHHSAKMKLHIPPTQEVAIGKQGWLFFGDPSEWNDVRGLTVLTPLEKERWRHHLNRAHDALKAQGIPFIFAISPDKSSIYPELLPANIHLGQKRRLDDLLEWLRTKECRATIVDLRPMLLKERERATVYEAMDTHWNSYGASIAAEAMLGKLNEQGLAIAPYHFEPRDYAAISIGPGDLATLARQPESREYSPVLKEPIQPAYDTAETIPALEWLRPEMPIAFLPLVATKTPGAEGHLLMFRASFTKLTMPYLSPLFGQADYVWMTPNSTQLLKAVADVKPTVVIQETAERLLTFTPVDPNFNDGEDLFATLPKEVFIWPGTSKLKPSGDIGSTTAIPGGMHFNLTGPKFRLYLRDVPLASKGMKMLRCRVKAPGATRFRVFTKPIGSEEYDKASVAYLMLQAGWNEVVALLPEESLGSDLRVEPGSLAGEYEVTEMSIRTE